MLRLGVRVSTRGQACCLGPRLPVPRGSAGIQHLVSFSKPQGIEQASRKADSKKPAKCKVFWRATALAGQRGGFQGEAGSGAQAAILDVAGAKTALGELSLHQFAGGEGKAGKFRLAEFAAKKADLCGLGLAKAATHKTAAQKSQLAQAAVAEIDLGKETVLKARWASEQGTDKAGVGNPQPGQGLRELAEIAACFGKGEVCHLGQQGLKLGQAAKGAEKPLALQFLDEFGEVQALGLVLAFLEPNPFAGFQPLGQ